MVGIFQILREGSAMRHAIGGASTSRRLAAPRHPLEIPFAPRGLQNGMATFLEYDTGARISFIPRAGRLVQLNQGTRKYLAFLSTKEGTFQLGTFRRRFLPAVAIFSSSVYAKSIRIGCAY